jgi:hypothetical protein
VQEVVNNRGFILLFGVIFGVLLTLTAPPLNDAWPFPWMIIHIIPILTSGLISGSPYYYNFWGYLAGGVFQGICVSFLIRAIVRSNFRSD